MVNRRDFLKLISLGVIGHTIDIDRLLWVPGEKTIFIPSTKRITLEQIIALELDRIAPKIATLFERDNFFYASIMKD